MAYLYKKTVWSTEIKYNSIFSVWMFADNGT